MWKTLKDTFSSGWDYLSPLIDKVKNGVDWIAKSWLGKKMGLVGEFVEQGATSVGGYVVNKASQLMGGVPAAADAMTGYQPPPSSAQQIQSATQGLGELQGFGWTRAQSLGLLSNFQKESGFNPAAEGDKKNGVYTAYGIGQWHKDRQDEFAKWSGHDIHGSTLAEQIAFANYELRQGREQDAGKRLKGATNEAEAGSVVSEFYERPKDVEGNKIERAAGAVALGKAVPTIMGTANDNNIRSPLFINQPAPPASTKISLELGNLPDGTRVRSVSTNMDPPKIERAMRGY